jgi:polar amino acid transport system substrate-binding protein
MSHLALLILLSVFSAHLLAVPSESDCRLNVGWEEWFPLFYQQDGRLQGPEYELLIELAQQADCQLEFFELPWKRQLKRLENADLDLLYGASRTPERELFARFSHSYRTEKVLMVVRASSIASPDASVSLRQWLATPNDAGRDKTLGLILGYYYGDALNSIIADPTIKSRALEVRWDQQLQELLSKKRIDGYMVEASVAHAQLQAAEQQLQLLTVDEHRPEPMFLMFSKSVSPAIVERFNRAIDQRVTASVPPAVKP